MTPSESAPEVPHLTIPSRSALLGWTIGFVLVVTLVVTVLASKGIGAIAVLTIAAVVLLIASVIALLVFRIYQLGMENAQYVVEDQAFQIYKLQHHAGQRGAGAGDRQEVDAAKQESARLGGQLADAHQTVEALRRKLEDAAGAASGQGRPTHDVLTGLRYGAVAFETRITELIAEAQRSGGFHGVLLVGIDQLDGVLDHTAPVASDEYIWTVAKLIGEGAEVDTDLFRVSAKHFGLVLPDSSNKAMTATAQKILSAVSAREFSWGGKTYQGSVSVGALSIGLSDISASDIVERAIHAHAQASGLGGNRVHQESMLPMLERRNRDRSLRDWLEDRLDHEHQRLAAQAIVPVDGKAALATWHELLLRIEDDDGVWLPPEHYVDVLERLQLTGRIDRWVLHNALRRGPAGDRGHERRLSINVFGSSLARESFLAELRDVLANSAWPTSQICFEIDEATIVQRPSRVAAFVAATSEFGCQLAIDRYRGVEGLTALRSFPAQFVKLHDSLLVRRSTDAIDQAHLQWLVDSAHMIGAKVVAVGVRDDEMAERARSLKADFVQGYALSPPAPWAG